MAEEDQDPECDQDATEATVAEQFAVLANELREVARRMSDAGQGHTLQPTALVNEVFLKLTRNRREAFQDDGHLMRVAARAMRQLIIDHKRGRSRQKRGGDVLHVSFDELVHQLDEHSGGNVLDLHEALNELAERDPVAADLVTLRFFGGRSVAEAAQAVGLKLRTAEQRLRTAKAWLHARLAE